MDQEKRQGMVALFMYVGIAIALIVTVVSSFITVFGIIDYLIPKESASWYWIHRGIFDALSGSVSFLLVSFGILYYVSCKVRLLTGNQFAETVYYKVCHAIILFVLVLSFLAVAISSALLLSGILGGDISLGYFFKLLFVAGVGGLVFFYYRGVLRGVWRTHRKEERTLVCICAFLIVLIVITAVAILNPLDRKEISETLETLEIIEAFSNDVDRYYAEVKNIPVNPGSQAFLKHDAVYHGRYLWEKHLDEQFTYKRINAANYRVCASFEALPTDAMKKHSGYPYERFEIEKRGETCFDLSAQ